MLLQYTIKDRVPGLAVLFYALPPLVIAVAALLSVGLLSRRASLSWVAVSIAAAVLAMVTWIRTDLAYTHPPASAGDLRIVLWNIGHCKNTTAVADALRIAGGQVIVLIESDRPHMKQGRVWDSRLPNHTITYLPGCVTLLSVYPVSKVSVSAMGISSRVLTCELSTPAGPVSLAMVDLESNLFSFRGPLIARVYESAESMRRPTIVLGDFNTPLTSAFFRDFRGSFRHAFASSGSGLIPTWPALLPVLDLDHIWLSPDIVPVRARTLRTLHSDHAAVIADVKLPSGTGE
ncbi:MAG: endonuclease/exonuclease/phosphatase family protein [Phycisphaerales bacterium]